MPDNKWEKLETELVKDFWGKSEACHIFAGLIRVVRRGSIKPSLQIVEEKQTIRAKEREQDRIKEVWDGTDHKPKGREIRSNGFTEEYSVAYCIRWAQKKRINIPWLNWAIKEGYIKAEDLEPENNNADADRVPGSDAAVTEEESENTVKNRLRLIGLMASMMQNKDKVGVMPFDNQDHLAKVIAKTYSDKYPMGGLSASEIKKLLGKANRVLGNDKVGKD